MNKPCEGKASEYLGQAYGALSFAQESLRADFRAGKYGDEHFDALEEELARIMTDTKHLARVLGWVRQ